MSSALKSEVKIAAAQEIGVRMDDLLEEAIAEVHQAAGAQTALLEAAKAIAKLHEHVSTDMDGGLYPLDVGAKIKAYVNRAITALESLAQRAGNMQMTAHGRKQALEKVVLSVKSFKDNETTKLAEIHLSEKTSSAKITETRIPQVTIKERRLAEEAAVVDAPKKRGRPQKLKTK